MMPNDDPKINDSIMAQQEKRYEKRTQTYVKLVPGVPKLKLCTPGWKLGTQKVPGKKENCCEGRDSRFSTTI